MARVVIQQTWTAKDSNFSSNGQNGQSTDLSSQGQQGGAELGAIPESHTSFPLRQDQLEEGRELKGCHGDGDAPEEVCGG